VPEKILALSGKRVAIDGYMMPLAYEAGGAKKFLLMKNQYGCCFAQTPKVNEWIEVTMQDGAVALSSTSRVAAHPRPPRGETLRGEEATREGLATGSHDEGQSSSRTGSHEEELLRPARLVGERHHVAVDRDALAGEREDLLRHVVLHVAVRRVGRVLESRELVEVTVRTSSAFAGSPAVGSGSGFAEEPAPRSAGERRGSRRSRRRPSPRRRR